MNYVYTVLLYILECIICKNKNIPGGDPDLMYKAPEKILTKKRVVTGNTGNRSKKVKIKVKRFPR